MKKTRLILFIFIAAWAISPALQAAGKVYKPDLANCAGFTAADAARLLNVPVASVTARSEKVHDALWTCTFTVGNRTLAFSVELAKSAEEASADMARYRENLELAATTAPFKDNLPKGAWSEISPLGEENTWTDVNRTLTVRQGNVTLQVQMPQDKLKQIEVALAFLKKL